LVLGQVVIPARFDSGRLPGKALIPLWGKPLLQHVWERAVAAALGPEPIVATDDSRIEAAARGFGAKVARTSAAHRCGSERVAEVVAGLACELVINLQGDEALIDPALLRDLLGLFSDPAVGMATAVAPLRDRTRLFDPSLVKAVLDDHGQVLYFSRSPIPSPERSRDDPSALFYGHIGVYAFRREFLLEHYRRPVGLLERMEGLEQLRVLQAGARIRALVWPQAEFGINTPEDLARAQAGSADPGSTRR
jgi:3-deoxy-manno-octulosonate cytidylyltransferase (CMP-KDO synthetase)